MNLNGKCVNCNEELHGNKRLYCSVGCKRKYLYKTKLTSKKCVVCGNQFLATAGTKCCSPECNLKSQQIYKKLCPVCGHSFSARGNGIYCSESCYRIANNPVKGLVETKCLVCGNSFKSPKNKEILTCSTNCEDNLVETLVENTLTKIFGTTDTTIIKQKIRNREEQHA